MSIIPSVSFPTPQKSFQALKNLTSFQSSNSSTRANIQTFSLPLLLSHISHSRLVSWLVKLVEVKSKFFLSFVQQNKENKKKYIRYENIFVCVGVIDHISSVIKSFFLHCEQRGFTRRNLPRIRIKKNRVKTRQLVSLT